MKYPITQDLSRTQWRQLIRQKRQSLSQEEQEAAGLELLEQIKQLSNITDAHNIALYLSSDGEIDTQPTINWLWQQGKQVLLPVLHPFSKGHLLFLKYHANSPICHNKYGIVEPKLDQTQVCPVSNIDIIFTPLVAFDPTGQRLGMGGGYYDRTLETWFNTGRGATPIGLAHQCQQVEHLPSQHWDIPLPIIVTPKQAWHWDINNRVR
ncbi:5-formyltetrahydrofolate cyclo-ligase [Vibrio rumoiensis]|uniref:5-formyltetrahydrofolate cyclo-ligase n=1 Tax=Vibrio rumoiensis 1S-45 TaxID=1188252 RepID=A0A1E5E4P6_9VIBR|nr:5-formyltetrahydrofolate cyclo-ligase [Vibrio rumoiensis]OEF27808.1 5-formyltetrahydrofolate cyclo-ligase [Vibrio rumoiensis 1S-45]